MMRTSKMRAARAICCVIVGVVVVLTAPAAVAGAGNLDSVQGGFGDYLDENIGTHAHSGPSGENPHGHESATTAGGDRYRLRVICLAVRGNLAAYGTLVLSSNNPDYPAGTEFVEVVLDSGEPGGAGDGWAIFDEPASTCVHYLDDVVASVEPITHGNIVIRDAPS